MLGSLGVIVAAIVIRFTGWAWVDSLVAVLIGFWVLPRTWILLRESLHVLLEGVPKEIQLAELREALLGIPGVTGLHDLHVWSITSGKISLTSHLVYDPALVDAEALLGTVEGAAARPLRDRDTAPCNWKPRPAPRPRAAGLLKTVQRKRRPAGSSSVISGSGPGSGSTGGRRRFPNRA